MFLKKSSKLLSVGALALAMLVAAQDAGAQRNNDDEDEAAATGTIDQRTGEVLTEAIEQINNDQEVEARATLATLRMDRLSPYERSRVEQILASLDYGDGNFTGAREHMQAALDSGGLNEQEASQMRYQMAQMWVSEEKWAEAAEALEAWIAQEPMPNSGAYYLLAVAYYQQEKYDDAIPHARKAVELTDMPQESWLQLLSALLIEKEDYAAAAVVVTQMVNLVPDKKANWLQLSSIYATLEDFASALVVLELAHHAGLLTEDGDLRRLADMMMVQDLPYRAATVLAAALEEKIIEPDLKFYESLANGWVAAREYEKSLPVLERAAELAPNGNNYVRLAEVNMQLEDWAATAAALEKGLDKGDLRNEGSAQLLMGIALYNQQEYGQARTWLQRAANSPNEKNTATGYMQLIDSKTN